MKKQMTIIQDNKQTRVGIPQEFVDMHKINSSDKIEFESNGLTLKARLIKQLPYESSSKKMLKAIKDEVDPIGTRSRNGSK